MTIPDLPSDGANPWGTSLRLWGNAMKAALSGKANASHTHTIGHVNQLASELSSKALAEHLHSISDVSGLQVALDARAALPNPSGNNDMWLGISSNSWTIKDLPKSTSTSLALRGGVGGSLRYIKIDNLVVVYGYITNVPPNYEFTVAIVPHKPLSHLALSTATSPTHVSYSVRNSSGTGSFSFLVPVGATARIWDNGNIDVRTSVALDSMYLSAAYAIA